MTELETTDSIHKEDSSMDNGCIPVYFLLKNISNYRYLTNKHMSI